MKKPWIGIPTRAVNERYIGQSRFYLDAIAAAGGTPLMIPCSADVDQIQVYAERADGLLLPGSPTDIDPVRYGELPHSKLGRVLPEREITDFTLLSAADARKLPVLGICFGVQSLNVHRGGTLIQDIPSAVAAALEHDQDRTPEADNPDGKIHAVRIAAQSTVRDLAGGDEIQVNSFHHQALATPGRGLRAVAWAPDGVIEAVEDTTGRFVVGVQWHPERGWQKDPVSRALFERLIHEASRGTCI